MALFDAAQPLAARMRPRVPAQFVGQQHLLGAGKPLREAIETETLHSMIFWGAPGVGKTSLAKMIAECCDVEFQSVSAVLAGVKDIRAAIALAQQVRAAAGRKTLLFVDEAHRFNKAQQDAFLPFVEDGTIIFVGATTENPSFELNNALLSRVRVYRLQALTLDELLTVLQRALAQDEALKGKGVSAEQDVLEIIARAADGDARRALNILEVAADMAVDGALTEQLLGDVFGDEMRRFDKGGDLFYEQISALHKSVRGSDPDAALYWFVRMIDGGCDPQYIARRVVRMASEDIGNADPRALAIAVQAWQALERLGSPEGELAIAQAIAFLAVAAKSNAIYKAVKEIEQAIAETGTLEVPLHLRNAPTGMMKKLAYGAAYQYAHDHADGFVPGEVYLPPELQGRQFYHPVDRGLERKIAEKLAELRRQNQSSGARGKA